MRSVGSKGAMAQIPKISVVIPTYNRAIYVTQAIESVLAQTVPTDEIIVVDDGSTDNTQEVLKRFGDRIRYIRQDNTGAGIARNTGIKSSKNEYVAFLDSDDLWEPNRLERQLEAAERYRHAPVLWFSDCKVLRPDGAVLPSKWKRDGIFQPDGREGVLERPNEWLGGGYFIWTPSVLVKREALLRVGLYGASRRAQDWALYVKLARIGSFGYVAEPLFTMRDLGDKSNFQIVLATHSIISILKELINDDELSENARARAFNWMVTHVIRASGLLRRSGHHSEARQQLRVIPGWWYRPRVTARFFLNLLRIGKELSGPFNLTAARRSKRVNLNQIGKKNKHYATR